MLIEREELSRLYNVEELTMKEIAEILGCCPVTVFNYMRKYGIESRKAMTEKTRDKLSKIMKGRPSRRKGYKHSDETKKKLSEAKKGKFIRPSEFGGHKKRRTDGYIYVFVPGHPMATVEGYVMEHVLVMEKAIGRYITRDEVVHHKNHKRDDNRLENLELMTFKEHARLHAAERRKNGWTPKHTVKVRNVETGEVFDSIRIAAKKYSVAPTNITRACRVKGRTSKSYHWEYVEEVC